eukprot:5623003-Alexandrium_andersonii.AAC.1
MHGRAHESRLDGESQVMTIKRAERAVRCTSPLDLHRMSIAAGSALSASSRDSREPPSRDRA